MFSIYQKLKDFLWILILVLLNPEEDKKDCELIKERYCFTWNMTEYFNYDFD